MAISNKTYQASVTLPTGGTQYQTVTRSIPVLGNTLLKAILFTAQSEGAYIRLKDGNNPIMPITGYIYFNSAQSPLEIILERELSGPPWVITFEGYNVDLFTVVSITATIITGDIRKIDNKRDIYTAVRDMRKLITEV